MPRRPGLRGWPDFHTVDLYAAPLGEGAPEPDVGLGRELLGDPAEAREDLTRRYPHLFPPPLNFPFTRVNAAAAITDGSTTTLITLAVPGARAGVVKRFGNTSSAFSDSRFSLLVNGKFRAPLIDVDYEYGRFNAPEAIDGGGILVVPGDTIQVQCRASGSNLTGVRARIGGYFFPIGPEGI